MNTNITLKFESLGKIETKKEMREIIFKMIKSNEFQFVKSTTTPSFNFGYFNYTVEVNVDIEF